MTDRDKLDIPNPKTRGNWGIQYKHGQFESIFKHKNKCEGGAMVAVPKDKCQRHDFNWTREMDKYYRDMRRFPRDKKKINSEIFGIQQEMRDGVINREQETKYGKRRDYRLHLS
jgi:uncharacterized protein (DUF885 family)